MLRTLSELPEVVSLAATERRAAQGRDVGARAGRPFHGFYHDCYVIGDDVSPELTQARRWLVEAAGSVWRLDSTSSA